MRVRVCSYRCRSKLVDEEGPPRGIVRLLAGVAERSGEGVRESLLVVLLIHSEQQVVEGVGKRGTGGSSSFSLRLSLTLKLVSGTYKISEGSQAPSADSAASPPSHTLSLIFITRRPSRPLFRRQSSTGQLATLQKQKDDYC
jgi:hypothetical protein